MPRTSEVLLSLILSSLMRHHRFVERFGFRFRSLRLPNEAAFDLTDRALLALDDGKAGETGCKLSSRGTGRGGSSFDANDEREEREGLEASKTGEGTADDGRDDRSLGALRFDVDILGLWTADGFGLPCRLYTPSAPKECGVE